MSAKNIKRAVGAAVIFCAASLALFPGRAPAASVVEAFMMLPDEQCGGFNAAERQAMIDEITANPGAAGPASVPDVEQPWLRLPAENTLILQRPQYGTITYKLFDGRFAQLLAVCRGRQRVSAADPVCDFDLCLFRLDREGLASAPHSEYLPTVSVLDFTAPDTLNDPGAARDIAAIGQGYNHCLTCNAGAQDRNTLDIITATSINSAVCGGYLPPYELLPLTWNGLEFVKPYDRAAPREGW
ncbi:MAG: hypothetical protein LBS31_11565 [Candidatus Adiutrix sp.]|jgi:hypothetical protein|nr:hypothetical protein [Candidatus Adiutrix sp.]